MRFLVPWAVVGTGCLQQTHVKLPPVWRRGRFDPMWVVLLILIRCRCDWAMVAERWDRGRSDRASSVLVFGRVARLR